MMRQLFYNDMIGFYYLSTNEKHEVTSQLSKEQMVMFLCKFIEVAKEHTQ